MRTMCRAQLRGLLDGAEHDGHVGAQPDRVGGAVGLQPLLGVDLVRAQHGPHLVVEDLGRGARQGLAARPPRAAHQVLGQGHPGPPGPLGDLQGGEAVDVDPLGGGPHGAEHVEVVVAVEVRVDAALQADLGGPLGLGLGHPPGDLVQVEQVGGAPQVERERPLGEGAEPALEGADVGVVDVAVDDEGDLVARRSAGAGRRPSRPPAGTSGPRAENSVTISSSPTSWPRATPASTSATAPVPAARRGLQGPASAGRAAVRRQQLGRGASPPEHHAVLPGQALGVARRRGRGKRTAGSSQRSGVEGVLGVDGEPGGQGVPRPPRWPPAARRAPARPARGSRGRRSPATRRPSRRCRRRAAGPGRRRGWAAPGRGPRAAAPAGPRRSTSAAPRRGHGGWPAMAVPGLGRKFWTITSWTWPWRRWESAMASRAASRSARVSPIPTRIPVVKGMAQLARPPPGWPGAASGALSGARRWAARSGARVSSIIPWLAVTGRRARQLVRHEGAGVGVGQQPGLLEHRRQASRPGSRPSRRTRARLSHARGRGVAQLGPLAQGEQRLVAAGLAPASGRPPGPRPATGRGRPAGPAPWRRCSSRSGPGRAW